MNKWLLGGLENLDVFTLAKTWQDVDLGKVWSHVAGVLASKSSRLGVWAGGSFWTCFQKPKERKQQVVDMDISNQEFRTARCSKMQNLKESEKTGVLEWQETTNSRKPCLYKYCISTDGAGKHRPSQVSPHLWRDTIPHGEHR